MKIEAFNDKWNIEVTEHYVKVTSSNGKTATMTDYNTDFSKVLGVIIYDEEVAPQEQIISSDKDADVFFDSVFNAKEPNQLLKDASQEQPTAEQVLERIENKKISNSGHYTKEELIFFAEYFAKIYHKEQLGLSQPTDCDGTPLNYGDRIVCVKEFTCKDGLYWEIGYEEYYAHQSLFSSYTTKIKEFTPSELKNFRKVN